MNPTDLSVYASIMPSVGDLSKPEIEIIQSRLREMGYHMVGKVDGIWGPSTTGAIAALQETAGIPVSGHYDEATRIAMKGDRSLRIISPQRATTTVDDLRNEGSKTIKQADRVTFWSAAMTVLSAIIAFVTFISAHWAEASKMAESVRPILNWIPAGVWPAVVTIIGSALWLTGNKIKEVRVESERTGVHNGDPGLEPVAEGARSIATSS